MIGKTLSALALAAVLAVPALAQNIAAPGPTLTAVRAKGEQVGHVTTAEYGSQMLSLGGVRHLTGGSKKEGTVTCETLLALCEGRAVELAIDGGHGRQWRRHA